MVDQQQQPENHFDKKLLAGLIVFLICCLMAYVRFTSNPADLLIGGFIGWIGNSLGNLGNMLTGRPQTRTADKGMTVSTEPGTTGTITAEVKNP